MIRSSSPKLRVDIDDGVARIFIDNAAKRNAFDFEMWQALPNVIRAIDADPRARVLVLGGESNLPFCSGADISEFSTLRATSDGGRAYEAANVAAFDALSQSTKPTFAAIAGFCFGGGVGLAAACDVRLGREDAIFAIPAVKLGVGYPPAAMRYVVATMGAQRAFDLFYTARRLTAQEAFNIGFIAYHYSKGEFDSAVMDMARAVAQNAPLTILAAKSAIRTAAFLPGALTLEECEILADACFDSADFVEGRNAFLDKRTPKFIGK
jgi:enoyl-CoA hydratase/carnithine racemase